MSGAEGRGPSHDRQLLGQSVGSGKGTRRRQHNGVTMKSEADPITDDEWLLRRVRVEMFRTEKTPLISPKAFEPRVSGREPDTDGISFYRAACLANPEDVLATIAPQRWQEYGIVRLSVSFLKSLKLSLVSKPDDRVRGHVVIPELNANDYGSDEKKRVLKAIVVKLAEQASKDENIVRRPGSEQ